MFKESSLNFCRVNYVANLIFFLCFFFIYIFEEVHARDVQDINPSWSVEDQEVEDFIKSMIQTYVFIQNIPTETASQILFFFPLKDF